MEEEVCEKPAPGVEEGIEVKTKFPVARIKRIMQADEDVGKVSQVTPTAVCECFSLSLFLFPLYPVPRPLLVHFGKRSKSERERERETEKQS